MLLDKQLSFSFRRVYVHSVRQVIGVFTIMLLMGILSGCGNNDVNVPSEVATQHQPALSPSGKYLLVVVTGNDGAVEFQSFQILDQDKEPLYLSKDRFATRHTAYFLWDKDDRVWVYSGDVGTFFWQHTDGGNWEKHVYTQSDISAPEFLKEKYPDRYTR